MAQKMKQIERVAKEHKPLLPEESSETINAQEFQQAFGESITATLDIDTWQPGENLAEMYNRLEREVREAVKQEDRIRKRVRSEVFERIKNRPGAPPCAGVYSATIDQVESVHRGLLFTGQVEGCDGTSVVHDTLPITIAQIGVALVSYRGDQGTWIHRLFRRDLRVAGSDPLDEALNVLEKRQRRGGFDAASKRDTLSSLARRGIMAYAERAVLLKKSDAPWRVGHGNPLPYELLTGSGIRQLLSSSIDLLNDLVHKHQRFLFVPSAPAARMLLTIGNALLPLEYAIIDTLEDSVNRIVDQGHYRGEWRVEERKLRELAKHAGTKVVAGTYRASAMSPAQVFYAHTDHAHEAALIAMADSVLHEHRGFPMLIDLADNVCRATLGSDTFYPLIELAYAQSGEPFRYIPERQTR
jgi:hypothetical protein